MEILNFLIKMIRPVVFNSFMEGRKFNRPW